MTRRLRIASLCTTLHIGGDENRLLAFATAVDRSRFDHVVVVVVSPTAERDRTVGPMLARYRERGIEVIDLQEPSLTERRANAKRGSRVREAGAFLQVVWRLARLFRDRRIDVVDARMMYATLLGLAAARLARVPVVVSTEYDLMYWYRSFWRVAIEAAFPRLDALICDSQARLDEMRRLFVRRPPHGVVVPNGILTPETRLGRVEARARIGLPADPAARVVGQVSRLVPGKGHRILLEAARRVLDRRSDAWFVVCGYVQPAAAGYRDELERLARSLGIADRVRFVSHPGSIGDVWAAIDVHAHATLHDSAPIAIHESMALGLPAVVTAVAGIPEMVDDERTGLVVPPGDPERFAQALLRVLDEPETARRLGDAARARHEERYRPALMTARLEALFEELVARRRSRARVPAAQVGAAVEA